VAHEIEQICNNVEDAKVKAFTCRLKEMAKKGKLRYIAISGDSGLKQSWVHGFWDQLSGENGDQVFKAFEDWYRNLKASDEVPQVPSTLATLFGDDLTEWMNEHGWFLQLQSLGFNIGAGDVLHALEKEV